MSIAARKLSRKSATACVSIGTCRSRWMTAWSLRADVFPPDRPKASYPVLLTMAPTPKGSPSRMAIPAPGSAWSKSIQTSPPARPTNIRTGKWSTRRNGCRTVMSACAWIHAAAGRSPGVIDHFSPRETKDFYDCIEWAGVQPWSNGKVGLNGISYYAHEPMAGGDRCSRRISPRCASGRAPPTGIAT